MRSNILAITVLLILGFTRPAVSTGKYILLVFEGSDWCPNCIRLEKTILSDKVFIDYLDINKIVLIKVDFPQQKKLSREQKSENEQLARKYNFEGIFPTVVLSRTDTLMFEKIIYINQSTSEFTGTIGDKLKKLE